MVPVELLGVASIHRRSPVEEMKDMNGNLLEILAREKAGMPAGWRVYKFECLPHGQDTIYYELAGAIVPRKTRGPHVGSLNWRRMDKTTRRPAILTVDAAANLADEWSKRTGLCITCVGKGQTLRSWSASTGSIFNPCKSCNGTGKRL